MKTTTALAAATLLLLSGCELLGLAGHRTAPASVGTTSAPPPGQTGQPTGNRQPAATPAPAPGGQLVDCSRAEYRSSERPGALVNRSGRAYRAAKNWSQAGTFPTAQCRQAVNLRAQAYCQKPHVRYYQSELKRALQVCRAWDARRRAYQKDKASGGSGLLASMTPAQARRKVNSWLMWARSSRGGRKALGYYALVLHHQPTNPKATAGFDQAFAAFYGVTPEVAAKYRAAKQYTGRLAAMPKQKLYALAVNELVGGLHSIVGGQPKLGLSYLDVLFLMERVFVPALRANIDAFRSIQCSRNLASARKDFRPKAVKAALGTGACKPSRTVIRPSTVMRDERLRMALIEILAKQTANPADTIAKAALAIARQVGAKKTRVCWTAWNPMKIRPGIGNKCGGSWSSSRIGGRRARRSRYRSAALTDKFLPRHAYYAMVYAPKPLKKLTAFETLTALAIARKAGASGAALTKQLTKHKRRAKKYKCVAFRVTMQRFRRGRGSWSKVALRGVGSSKDISCRKVRRNNALRKAVPKHWNNFYDTVRGGKYTGRWQERRTWRKRRYSRGWYWDVRRTRPAVIYVRRKM